MGLVFRRMMNQGETVQFPTSQMIVFKDNLIDWYSTAQGAGVLQTIQAMQVASQPGAKQLPYQGLPWFGVSTSLYAIAYPAIAASGFASVLTAYIANALIFAISVFVFFFFLIFAIMFRTKGLHQLSSGGGQLIFAPLIGAGIMSSIAYVLKSNGVSII